MRGIPLLNLLVPPDKKVLMHEEVARDMDPQPHYHLPVTPAHHLQPSILIPTGRNQVTVHIFIKKVNYIFLEGNKYFTV